MRLSQRGGLYLSRDGEVDALSEEKQKPGRPLKFKSAKALQERIDAYFESCFRPVLPESGLPVVNQMTGEPLLTQFRPFTMGGLAAYLDCDRKTLLNYSERDEYFLTIKRARQKIEAYAEEQLYTPKIAAGVIFNLKNNFGWKDQQDVQLNGSMEVKQDPLTDILEQLRVDEP